MEDKPGAEDKPIWETEISLSNLIIILLVCGGIVSAIIYAIH